jgi:hypothetical protein
MNERIKELAEKAGMFIIDDKFSSYGKYTERFAELIIKECAEEASDYDGACYVGEAVTKHFGINND